MLPPILEQSTEPEIDQPKVNGNCLGRGGPIRLNLGGIGDDGNDRILKGFLVVDLQDLPLVDVQCDVSKLTPFQDNSVDEIYASNVLEHFMHTDTVRVLQEWRRVLKPGATCWISVPDMDANFRLFQKNGLTQWVQNIIWGDQIHPHAFHYINFTFASLAKRVNEAGFSDVKRVDSLPYGINDASAMVDGQEHKPTSLNIKAIK